ncbi:MAG: hypothetical protein SVW57_10970 [Thermodesulfobacteriota bacterium]|nr:hypothetical protein [Thermodesulfobacteriota bacterium]
MEGVVEAEGMDDFEHILLKVKCLIWVADLITFGCAKRSLHSSVIGIEGPFAIIRIGT